MTKAPVSNLVLLNYIKDNPKSTNKAIAAALGLETNSLAARTRMLFQQGRVKREKVGSTLSNVGILGYSFISYTTKESEKKSKGTNGLSKKEQKEPLVQGVVADRLIHDTLMSLSSALAGAIVGHVRTMLAVELNSMVPEPTAHIALPSMGEILARVDENAKKPSDALIPRKVCIVGLLPQQAGMLDSEFGDCFDLRFWHGDKPSTLKDMARYSEVTLIHTSHSGHLAQEVVKSVGAKYKLIGGGMTKMRDELTAMYLEYQPNENF